MKTYKSLLVIVPLFAAILALLVWALWPFQPGCPYLKFGFQGKCEFERMFPASDLLVQTSYFQDPVSLLPYGPLNHHGAAERVSVELIQGGKTIGAHEIQRWATSDMAERAYTHNSTAGEFPMFPCGIKSNMDYESPVADNFCAACSVGDHCRAVGQYQDYVSIFEFDLDQTHTLEDFQEIIARIDQRFEEYLKLGSTPS